MYPSPSVIAKNQLHSTPNTKKNADKHLKNADKHLKNVQKKQNMKWLTRQKKYIVIMHSTHKSIIKSAHNKICVHPSQSETIHSNTSTKTAKNINFH